MIGGNDIKVTEVTVKGITHNYKMVIGHCYNLKTAKQLAREYYNNYMAYEYEKVKFKYLSNTFKIERK